MGITEILEIGNITVVKIAGRIDVHNSDSFSDTIADLLAKEKKNIVFDLKELTFITSCGLRTFITIRRKLNGMRGEVKLANMIKSVRHLFDTVELSRIYEIYTSLDDAILAFNE
jgi:anti-sigma B factor antagonist